MSTTTQILFNSPALHSLKREQLVKLCKIHSIKANGKNVELIQKLRQHAQTLPKDSPLSIAARSEPSGPIPIQPQHMEEDQDEEIRDEEVLQTSRPPRPSEQWEMVMDSIEEVEENSSQGTLSSQRTINLNGHTSEFGTGGSKSSTVSSSIKALATSLGLKRSAGSKSTLASTTSSKDSGAFPPPIQERPDELSQMSTPYASLPESTSMPQTDHFTLNDTRMSIGGTGEVLPGHALRPGAPAPPNARLSMGLTVPSTPTRQAQPTTTIRLVSNPLTHNPGSSFDTSYGAGECGTPQLKPFQTTFDITFGSPAPSGAGFGFGSLSTWPPRGEDDDVQMKGIYPTLTFDDLPPSVEMKTVEDTYTSTNEDNNDVAMPGAMTSNPPKSPEPFVFGTPQHKVTNDQFRLAAAAVLDDLNQKLREDGVDEIGADIIAKLHPNAKKEPLREIKPMPASRLGRGEITDKFQKMHEEDFRKMEGIDELVKRRGERSPPKAMRVLGLGGLGIEEEKVVVGKKRKSSAIERDGGAASGPRRPSAVAGRASATRVISNGRRAKAKVVIPGAFGMDEDDDEDDEPEEEAADRGGKRVRIAPEDEPTPEEERKQLEDEQQRRTELEREREAIRKKLEANRARRRSSAAHGAGGLAGRKSHGGRVSVGRPRQSLVKPKPKPSRFGFLSSAKTLVQSVWNRGKAPTAAAPSSIPKAAPPKAEPAKEKGKAAMGPPSLVPAKKSSIVPAKSTSTTAIASGSKAPSVRVSMARTTAATNASSTATRGSIASSTGTSRSRSPLPSFNNNSLQSNAGTRSTRSRTSSIVPSLPSSSRASSIAGIGTGASARSRTSSNAVSSIGTRLSSSKVSAIGTVGSMGSKNFLGRTSVASRTSAGSGSGSGSSRLSTSRLFAPTASSLAKATRSSSAAAGMSLKPVVEDKDTKQTQALGAITNSPAVHSPAMSAATSPSGPFSPRQGGIFSKPLLLPQQSGIPTPVKRRNLSGESSSSNGAREDGTSAKPNSNSTGTVGSTRTRSLNGRKPRISRSKVIARLASQRAASGSSVASVASSLAPKPRASGSGKTRSSLGAKVSRASYGGGIRSRASGGGGGVLLSAKKRARQSEYARRRSRVGPLSLGGQCGENERMQVE
ncbi:hypothetical protein GALMADRAFT_225367 [Galerina marginata CBS 339.88]|uniref:SAP domain-containing protein n=1 Tax=Galerina marginata (strain CBS 339.88) TaxID=685588 RepID=A0A067T287_GALM3|nr:hypothetical protein GALMADRAFT_225367 [Galerina marginata CBS 339.88]